MKKEITWTVGDGREVVFTVELVKERHVGHDDFIGDIARPCCEIEYSATLGGERIGGMAGIGGIKKINTQGCVAAFGPLGIVQANYDRIVSAEDEIKASAYWQAWQRKVAEGERVEREYDEHVARVNKMMGE